MPTFKKKQSHSIHSKSIKSVKALSSAGFIPKEKIAVLETVAQQFSVSITASMAELLFSENDDNEKNYPIHRQFVPDEKELDIKPYELNDPVGDHVKSPVPGIVHRYPDRCLLKVSNVCPIYCRFCFRREQIGHQAKNLSSSELETAYQYIESHPEIWEVILTGGDPLMLTPKQLSEILQRLEKIQSVEVIRIHTRIPVVDPGRINNMMLNALATKKALFIVLHANHANEFTPEASSAIANIINAGIPMLSQSVLLKGVNDDAAVMKTLLKTFVKHRIKPYYLHHCDLAKGTSHFRTTLDEGKKLLRSLRGHISGLCQPTYILDIPGGYGKVPVDSEFVTQCSSSKDKNTRKNMKSMKIKTKSRENSNSKDVYYSLEDYQGNKHLYPPKS